MEKENVIVFLTYDKVADIVADWYNKNVANQGYRAVNVRMNQTMAGSDGDTTSTNCKIELAPQSTLPTLEPQKLDL